MATVGENFKRIRLAKKIKQEQIFKRLGYQRASNVSLLETSERLPKPSTIKKMAAVLECETWELLEGVVTPWDALRDRDKEAQRRGEASQTERGDAPKRKPFRAAESAKDHSRKDHRDH